jgi:hypothetical protein
MSDTSKKIIEEIHERNVKHRPKWYFLIKNVSIWTLLVATIFLGALSLSIEESVLEAGIGVHGFFSSEFFLLVFHGVSLLWLLCAILFVVFAFLNLRLTKEGYRYRMWWIVLGILLLVVTFGLLLGHEGVGDRMESAAEHALFYHGHDGR